MTSIKYCKNTREKNTHYYEPYNYGLDLNLFGGSIMDEFKDYEVEDVEDVNTDEVTDIDLPATQDTKHFPVKKVVIGATLGAGFIAGAIIVGKKLKNKFENWSVKNLEKKGYTVIDPVFNEIPTDENEDKKDND